MGGRAALALLTCASLVFLVVPAMAQTPDEACAADSLYLISPEQLDLKLEETGKPGLTVSWPNLDKTQATCFSLDGTAGLGFDVVVAGGFGDRVDRVFRFATPDSGDIGGRNARNITVTWQNQGPSTNGNIGGVFNLSNNGGLWSHSTVGSTWSQVNTGLPMTWQRTNVVALDRGTGEFMVAAFTGGLALDSTSKGLYRFNGVAWEILAADIFDETVGITAVAISPTNNDHFAVGTTTDGVFMTNDGGDTFTQWTSELDPLTPQASYPVSALNWESNRLFVFVTNWGLFVSEDSGNSFARSTILVPDNLDKPENERIFDRPGINAFAVDPSNTDRIVAALNFHGVYETTDGGATWHDLYGDLVVSDPLEEGTWSRTALAVAIDPNSPATIVVGLEQRGLYRTTDSGATWIEVGAAVQPDAGKLTAYSIMHRPGSAGEMLVMEDGWKLLQSTDSGATWFDYPEQPTLNTGTILVARRDNSGDFMLASNGGGIYIAGTTLALTETYSTTTSASLRDLDLGLNITFDDGLVQPNDDFELVAQTFQGWALWRGASHTPGEMTLLGLFDRVNPEDCFEGFCGDNSLEIVPLCYAAKRAACFDISNPDTIRFFDEEVNNGFSYYYAVSSFDYGNTALTTAQNNTNEMLFSPRWQGDDLSPYNGTGNRTIIDVNAPAAVAAEDEEIYAYPNPVRLGAGVPRDEGNLVVFTNLPEGSRVRVFTTAGDDVINLGPDNQTGGQMYWRSVNREGEEISAGIYLYKVEMPAREDHWGRIVVIR